MKTLGEIHLPILPENQAGPYVTLQNSLWQRAEEDGEVDLRALRRPSLIQEVGMEKHFTSLVRVRLETDLSISSAGDVPR
jgi:hypothetical protein